MNRKVIFFGLLVVMVLVLLLAVPTPPTQAGKPPTRTPKPTATTGPTATPAPPTPTPSGCTPPPVNELQVHVIDVGQGNSALVTYNGKRLLVDSGELVESTKVANYLQSVLCNKAVDYFVVSHYHSDHFGSYVDLLRNKGVTVGTATYDRGGSRTEYSSMIYAAYYDYCNAENPNACKRTTIKEGDTINLGAGITVKAVCAGQISPVRVGGCGQAVKSENDYNITILVTVGSLDVWIGGDTSGDSSGLYYADVETAAVNQGKIGNSLDFYGVDHHGSCYSTNANFVNATLPKASAFSLGYNDYGHPCPSVVTRLTNAGSAIYYTQNDQGQVVDGNVTIKYSGGSTYTIAGARGTNTFTTK